MRYSIVEYKKQSPNVYVLCGSHYDLSCKETIEFIRHYSGICDSLVVYAGETDEVFVINILTKTYDKYYLDCDKTLSDYINSLCRQIEKRGYLRVKSYE